MKFTKTDIVLTVASLLIIGFSLAVMLVPEPEVPIVQTVVYPAETRIVRVVRPALTEEDEGIFLTDEEVGLIARVCYGAAEGEPETGKRLVIDTILNRLLDPDFPDTVEEVIFQKNQYPAVNSPRIAEADSASMDYIRSLVRQEAKKRNDENVLFFSTGWYSPYGTRLFMCGRHYFSGRGKEE